MRPCWGSTTPHGKLTGGSYHSLTLAKVSAQAPLNPVSNQTAPTPNQMDHIFCDLQSSPSIFKTGLLELCGASIFQSHRVSWEKMSSLSLLMFNYFTQKPVSWALEIVTWVTVIGSPSGEKAASVLAYQMLTSGWNLTAEAHLLSPYCSPSTDATISNSHQGR